MSIYAILNKDTNVVTNIIIADDESYVFLNSDEYCVVANRAVEKGMTYDKKTNSFPGVGDKGELLDLRDQIVSLAVNHQKLISEHSYLTEQQREVQITYVNNLFETASLETYSEMKSQFDSLGLPPEFPPEPKEITQDEFRNLLKLTEKILWDNPETGTEQQKAVINTMKLDFPFSSVEDMQDELDLLESLKVIGTGRAAEIASQL